MGESSKPFRRYIQNMIGILGCLINELKTVFYSRKLPSIGFQNNLEYFNRKTGMMSLISHWLLDRSCSLHLEDIFLKLCRVFIQNTIGILGSFLMHQKIFGLKWRIKRNISIG